MTTRRNVIATIVGKKGSGKSYLLDARFTARAPRVVSLDFVGEVKERNPGALETVGLRQTLEAIQDLAQSGVSTWHIAAVFDQYAQHELPAFFRTLAPPYNPGRVGLSRALGGMALECGECDVILPNSGASVEARNMVKRGRHEMLDLFFATQRPQECSRLCTSQADYVISFRMHEPRELAYLSDTVSAHYAVRVKNLPRFHSLWYEAVTGNIFEMDAHGRQVSNTPGELGLG